jgi:hypothetical protein
LGKVFYFQRAGGAGDTGESMVARGSEGKRGRWRYVAGREGEISHGAGWREMKGEQLGAKSKW